MGDLSRRVRGVGLFLRRVGGWVGMGKWVRNDVCVVWVCSCSWRRGGLLIVRPISAVERGGKWVGGWVGMGKCGREDVGVVWVCSCAAGAGGNNVVGARSPAESVGVGGWGGWGRGNEHAAHATVGGMNDSEGAWGLVVPTHYGTPAVGRHADDVVGAAPAPRPRVHLKGAGDVGVGQDADTRARPHARGGAMMPG